MQNQMKRYSIFGPVQTAGQFRLRQGGTSFHPSPSICRGRDHGRRRELSRALPRALRLPREVSSPSLLSGCTAIILTTLYNGDRPAGSATPGQ